jgi:hypothetical protein
MSRHNAPPVVYPAQRSPVLGFLLLACWATGVGVLTLWVLAGPAWDWRSAVALLLVACTGSAAWVSWQTSCSGRLGWDGEHWHWDTLGDSSLSEESTLSVVADAQFALLLLFETASGARRWLWLERASQPERWMDLRRAVYCPHRASIPVVPPYS